MFTYLDDSIQRQASAVEKFEPQRNGDEVGIIDYLTFWNLPLQNPELILWIGVCLNLVIWLPAKLKASPWMDPDVLTITKMVLKIEPLAPGINQL